MVEKVIVDWQAGMKVMERMEHLFKNPDLLGDVTFEVYKRQQKNSDADEKACEDTSDEAAKSLFKAHRFILATGSAVFHTMFFGSLPPKPDEVVEVDDVAPDAFGYLLRFLYTDTFVADINVENALDVVYAAKKYGLDRLVSKCEDLLIQRLRATEAPYFCMQANFFDLKHLETRCWDLIDRKAKAVLQSDSILQLDKATMEKIVRRKSLRVREVHVFGAAERWAQHHKDRKSLALWVEGGLIKAEAMNREEIKRTLAFWQELFLDHLFRELYLNSRDLTTILPHRVVPTVDMKLATTVKTEDVEQRLRMNYHYHDQECFNHQTMRFSVSDEMYFVGCTINKAEMESDTSAYRVSFSIVDVTASGMVWLRSDSVIVTNTGSQEGRLKVLMNEPWICLRGKTYELTIDMNRNTSKAYEMSKMKWICGADASGVNMIAGEFTDHDLCRGSLSLTRDSYNRTKMSHRYGFVMELHFEET